MRTKAWIPWLILIIVALAGVKGWQYWQGRQVVDQDKYSAFFKGVTATNVSQVVIDKTNEELKLVKVGDKVWQVGDYPVDMAKLDALLPSLLAPTGVQLVAESDANLTAFGISSTSAKLVLSTPVGEKKVIVGQTEGMNRYVQLTGIPGVYLIAGLPTTVDLVLLNDWMDKVVLRIEEQSLKKVSLVYGKKLFSMTKQENVWQDETGKEVETAKSNGMVMTLASLTTTGIASIEAAKLPTTPTATLTIERLNQEAIGLKLYKVGNDNLLTIDGRTGVYALTLATMNNLMFEL